MGNHTLTEGNNMYEPNKPIYNHSSELNLVLCFSFLSLSSFSLPLLSYPNKPGIRDESISDRVKSTIPLIA